MDAQFTLLNTWSILEAPEIAKNDIVIVFNSTYCFDGEEYAAPTVLNFCGNCFADIA